MPQCNQIGKFFRSACRLFGEIPMHIIFDAIELKNELIWILFTFWRRRQIVHRERRIEKEMIYMCVVHSVRK